MKWLLLTLIALSVSFSSTDAAINQDRSATLAKTSVAKPSSEAAAVSNQEKKPVVASPAKPGSIPQPLPDSLVITARLIEIPGKFAPNDLYNYVYIMKYRVVK